MAHAHDNVGQDRIENRGNTEMMGISVWQLLIVLAIVVLLFGTRRLRSFGADMGESIRSFRSAVRTEDNEGLRQDTDELADAELRQLARDLKHKS